MLFTGDSNLGKSYTNFLCYYLLSLASSNRLDEFLKNKIIGYNGNEEFSFVVKTSDIRLWMEDDVRRFFVDYEKVGNTVSSTIPIALCHARKQGVLKGNVMLAGFGVGLSWAAVNLKVDN